MSRAARARAAFLIGLVLAAAGLAYETGWGWGALLLGAGLALGAVLLYDVDEPATDEDAIRRRGEDW